MSIEYKRFEKPKKITDAFCFIISISSALTRVSISVLIVTLGSLIVIFPCVSFGISLVFALAIVVSINAWIELFFIIEGEDIPMSEDQTLHL